MFWKNPETIPSIEKVLQFSCSVVSDSWRPHESQHPRPPCPSPTPGVHSDSYPLNQWCHPAISSSVVPFSSCPQSFSASGSFQMSQLFTSGGQSIGVLASTSVPPMNTQDWFPLGWTGWISLQSKGLSKVFSWRLSTLMNHTDTSSPTVYSLHWGSLLVFYSLWVWQFSDMYPPLQSHTEQFHYTENPLHSAYWVSLWDEQNDEN